MAITLVGVGQDGSANNGNNVTLTFSVAPIEDDVVIVLGTNGNDGDAQSIALVTSGYTEEGDLSVAEEYHTKVWSKRMGASPDTTVEIDGGGDAQDAVVALSYVLRGVDTTTLLDAVVTTAQQGGNDWDPASIVTVTDDAWVLVMGATGANGTPSSDPTNYINPISRGRVDTNRTSAAGATREIASNGTEDPGAFTWTASPAGGFTIAIRPAPAAVLSQIHFRMRPAGADPAINADTGGDWAFAEDTSGTLACLDEYPLAVRIRFQIKATVSGATEAYELWYDKDAAASYSIIPNQSAPWTESVIQNEVMLVPSLTFSEAAATTRLLTTGTFKAGEGRHSEPTGSIVLTTNDITEIEFCVLIRKWSNNGHVPDASTFDFRVRKSDGTVLDNYDVTPRVTIGNKPGHIGGAMPETPSNLLIVEDTGVLYTVIEATDDTTGTFKNELVVVKSTDGGDTWTAPDLANRPGTTFDDIEAVDVQYIAANDRLYIVWQGPATDSVYYVEFNTSGHASPDEYGTVEAVDEAVTPPVFSRQFVSFRRRASDGVGWIVYGDNNGTDDQATIKKRTAAGVWESQANLDGETQNVGGGMMEIDSSNIIHILYMVTRGTALDADLYHRSINTSETLSGRTAANDSDQSMTGDSFTRTIPHTPPRIYDDGGTEKIGVAFITNTKVPMFTDSDVGTISFVTDEAISTTTVASSAGTSGQAQMALMWDDTDDVPVVLFTDELDESLLKIVTRPVSTWTGEATELNLTNTIGWVRGRVFTHSSGNGDDRVVGYISDEHLNPGGTGGISYREIVRAVGGASTVIRRRLRTTVRM